MLRILLIQITTAFLKDKLLVKHEASDVYVRLLRGTLILSTFSFFPFLKLTFVDPCIIVQFIKKIQQNATMYQKVLLFYTCMKLKMFRTTHRPSSGA